MGGDGVSVLFRADGNTKEDRKKQASWNQRPWSSIKEVRRKGKFEKRKRAQSLLNGPASPREVVGNLVNYQSLNKPHWQWRSGKDWQTPNKKDEAIQNWNSMAIIYPICLLALEKYLYMEGSKKLLFDMREIKEEKKINERWKNLKMGRGERRVARVRRLPLNPEFLFLFTNLPPLSPVFVFYFVLYQLT